LKPIYIRETGINNHSIRDDTTLNTILAASGEICKPQIPASQSKKSILDSGTDDNIRCSRGENKRNLFPRRNQRNLLSIQGQMTIFIVFAAKTKEICSRGEIKEIYYRFRHK